MLEEKAQRNERKKSNENEMASLSHCYAPSFPFLRSLILLLTSFFPFHFFFRLHFHFVVRLDNTQKTVCESFIFLLNVRHLRWHNSSKCLQTCPVLATTKWQQK